MRQHALLATLSCFLLTVTAWACDKNQYHNGCRIRENLCECAWGCRNEFIYRTRRSCNIALKEIQATKAVISPELKHSSEICSTAPCVHGICIQTTNDFGFTCKCAGTGFYGQRCEKACSTPEIGRFPHECVII